MVLVCATAALVVAALLAVWHVRHVRANESALDRAKRVSRAAGRESTRLRGKPHDLSASTLDTPNSYATGWDGDG